MTLREIQLVSLELLKEIRDFCETHQIRYYLAYGTLLGAVRHKGFIPWDDDIDIEMPRPDYERFVREFEPKSKNKLFSLDKTQSLIPYARFCDMERTLMVFQEKPWSKNPTGIYIDIFPIDGINEKTFAEHKKQAEKMWRRSWGMRLALTPFSKNKGFSKKLKWLTRKCIYELRGTKRIKRHIDFCKNISWETTNTVCQLSCPDPNETCQEKQWYEKRVLLQFEDDMFSAPHQWSKVLNNIFGDYMKLPPEEDRIPHTSYARFYWRE